MEPTAHFNSVAPHYRTVRFTDEQPVDYIAHHLKHPPSINGIEFGSGSGRYSKLLFQFLGDRLHLTLVDISAGMLKEAKKHFEQAGITRFEIMEASVEDVTLPSSSYNAIFSFNAVHHFNLASFLKRSAQWLSPLGHIFIYTRSPEQNADHIWGQYFPEFAEREQRLYTTEAFRNAAHLIPSLRPYYIEYFAYQRQATLEEILYKTDHFHYSTFRTYIPDEFAKARAEFVTALKKKFTDLSRIRWIDRNVMIHLQRTEAPSPV